MSALKPSSFARIRDDMPDLDAPMPNRQVSHVASMRPVLRADDANKLTSIFGAEILNDETKTKLILNTIEEVKDEGRKALRSYLQIGRSLLDLREALTRSEFKLCLDNSQTLWSGFTASNITKLIAVADAWEKRLFAEDDAPQSYSILYEFTTFDDGFDRAKRDGIFRPDVTRDTVTTWKKGLLERNRRGDVEPAKLTGSMSKLVDERDKLAAQLTDIWIEIDQMESRKQKLLAKVEQIEGRIGKIDAHLPPGVRKRPAGRSAPHSTTR